MLCIPSVEFNYALPKVYKTPHNKELYLDGEKEMWRVALATSAAPVYFPSVDVFKDECNIDGGLWANNPTIIGVAEAIKNNCKLENIKVLSIGTNVAKYMLGNNFIEINFKLPTKIKLDSVDETSIKSLLNAGKVECQNSYKIGKNVEKRIFNIYEE